MELEYCVNVSNKYSLFLQDEDEDPLELIEKTLKLSDKDGDKGKKKDRKGAPLKSSSHNAAAVGVGAVGGKVSAASARKTPSEAVETKEFKREDKENKISKSSDASRNTTVRRPFRAPEKEGLENRRPPPRDRFRPERGNLPPRLSGTPRNDDVTSPPIEDRMVGRFGDTNRGFSRGRGRGRGERGFSFGRGRGVGDRFASSGDQFWAGGGGMNSYSENDSEDKSFIPTYNTFGINSEDSPDVQEGGGMNLSSRSLRGDFTSRGNRGGRSRGGRGRGIPYKGRQFDRQSGSDRSGVKPTDKREGGGAYNWGFPGDEFYNTAEVNTIADEGNIDKEDANKIEGQESGGEGIEDTEGRKEAQRELTLDEWKALQGPRSKPNFNIRKPGEGESNAEWKKLVPLKRDTQDDDEQSEELEDEEEMEDEDRHRKKPVVSIEIKFIDEPTRVARGGRGGRPSSRAGRGGRGEMGGRRNFSRGGGAGGAGGFSGGSSMTGSGGSRRDAPYKMDDESFPQLTPTVA